MSQKLDLSQSIPNLTHNLLQKNKVLLQPKTVYGIRTDISNNIQYFSWDKCCYIAGNYAIIYSIREKQQYFFPSHQDYGEITSFAIDEHFDTILLVIAQRPQFLYIRFINKQTMTEIESKFFDMDQDQSEYFLSLSVNAAKGYIAALTGPKTPGTVRIFQEEVRNSRKINFTIKLTSQTAYKNILINSYYPFYIAVYGEGGFGVIQINEQDKKTVSKIEVDPRSQTFSEFSTFLYTFVSCTWVSKNRLAILNGLCDVFVIEFFNKHKIENVYKKAIKSVNIFETQSRGKGIFSKNGNLFVCKDDGMIVKLEDKQMTEKNIVYEKVQRNSKFIQNLPRMDVHTISLNNPTHSTSNFYALLITSISGQIYYIDITNENSLSDGSNYKYLICPFHSEEITCLDVCTLKPLIVTCSKDKYACVWNYLSQSLEISEIFEEEPVSVSFHPNGLHLIVLFKEKITLIDILERKFHINKEISIFSPYDIKFNPWGNLFSVCYKNCFQIYNFYTCEVVFSSKVHLEYSPHQDEVRTLTWDEEGTGFATCGLDGRAFYWKLVQTSKPCHNNNLYSQEHSSFQISEVKVIEFYSRDHRFHNVQIYTEKETGLKRLLLLDPNHILEVEQVNLENEDENNVKTKPSDTEVDYGNGNVKKPKILFSKLKFSNFIFDIETRLFIFTSNNDHSPTIYFSNYPFILEKREVNSFQANSTGVKSIKASSDMKYLFSSGKDKCLFFFEMGNSSKYLRKDDSLLNHELILVKKDELDKDHLELRKELTKLDTEINREIENFEIFSKNIEKEIEECIAEQIYEKEKFHNEKKELEQTEKKQVEGYETELQMLSDEHQIKLKELQEDHEKNKRAKEKDKDKESELVKNETLKDETHERSVKKAYEVELEQMREEYNNTIIRLNQEINELKSKSEEIFNVIEKDKVERIENNDNQIARKRIQLEELKKTYDKFKIEQQKDEDKLKHEIKELKAIIKLEEAKKVEGRNNLTMIYAENAKLTKNIQELHNDKRDKEDTIVEKNVIKKELEKENQELEKFKFVLNYKIKELKQEKDPKENKLSTLEKQAKDMEKEIKNFEFSQANYIVDLSTNHEIMKLHERQIFDTEKNIEKLQNYKKLFQDSLYHSMKKVKNHKELKKELIKLKELFLDKEYIEQLEKPFDNNPELQRHFIETSINEYKLKLDNGRLLLSQDFNKIMRENRKLLTIVNELEQERKEIIHANKGKNVSKSMNFTRLKAYNKPMLPVIGYNREKSVENKIQRMKKQLLELEREILYIKEVKKKEDSKNEKRGRKNISVVRSEDRSVERKSSVGNRY
jgi:cilia- and flagella-associated protein 57